MGNRYIIGLGNYARGDDSIGLRVIEHIIDHNLDDDFKAVEIGNDGLRLMNYFESDTDKIVLVDCALIDQESGEYMTFDIKELNTRKHVDGFSTHEGDILKVAEMARNMQFPIPPMSEALLISQFAG